MLVYSLVITVCGNDRFLLSKGMDTIAEVVHKYNIPISWALNSRFIRSLGKKISEWHEKYNDQFIVMLDIVPFLPTSDRSETQIYAEQIVQMRDNLRRHILSEREKITEVLPWTELDVAGAIQKNQILVQILEELEFKGLWGYKWKRTKESRNEDYGCPFGYFYPSRSAHNVPGRPSSRIVGVPLDCLLTETSSFWSDNWLSRHKFDICTYLKNANWNRWLGYVQQLDARQVANLIKSDRSVASQWRQSLDHFFEWLSDRTEWQFMSINDAVSEYRLSFGKSEPTSIFLQVDNEDASFFYYDDECQLTFNKDQFTPTEIRNYVSPPTRAVHCIEFDPPLLLEFSPSRDRDHLVMKFEIESSKEMPYGIVLWDIPQTLNLIESDKFQAVRIGDNLIFLRVSLESGKNQIKVVMSI